MENINCDFDLQAKVNLKFNQVIVLNYVVEQSTLLNFNLAWLSL